MQNLSKISIHNFKGLESVQLEGCGRINALVGRNNSGKSSILHAIDIAGLAIGVRNWNKFQPKLKIKDLFDDVGAFSMEISYVDGSSITVKSNTNYSSTLSPSPVKDQQFKSILIWPDVSAGMKTRSHMTPISIIQRIENRDFANLDALSMLFAIKYYSKRKERSLTPAIYSALIEEIRNYFPDIDELESDRTENDIATLTYKEYGKTLDILYSGSGLKHFIDIILKVIISQANVVLLDEPEMGLHPDLQRRFLEYLHELSEKRGIQIFMATHSPVLLGYADNINFYRVLNSKGCRSVQHVSKDAVHTVISDLGIRPSDIFNHDICLLVEGASEIVFFEHIIRIVYREDFLHVAVGIIQYGGSAADGIISGKIDVSNIVPAQKYTFWTRDRDTPEKSEPSTPSTKFKNALTKNNIKCHIWDKREIEFYCPESVLRAAQDGDLKKEQEVLRILRGNQNQKFADEAKSYGVCVPEGKRLKQLLKEHANSKDDFAVEIRQFIEGTLIPAKCEILGENQG